MGGADSTVPPPVITPERSQLRPMKRLPLTSRETLPVPLTREFSLPETCWPELSQQSRVMEERRMTYRNPTIELTIKRNTLVSMLLFIST